MKIYLGLISKVTLKNHCKNRVFEGNQLYAISSGQSGRFVHLDLLGKTSIRLSRHEAKELARYILAPASQHLKSPLSSRSSKNIVCLAVNTKGGNCNAIPILSKAGKPSLET
jgi:hypothetical protein